MELADWGKALGIALVVVVIGPLFWLGVKVLENFIQSRITLLRQRWRSRHTQ